MYILAYLFLSFQRHVVIGIDLINIGFWGFVKVNLPLLSVWLSCSVLGQQLEDLSVQKQSGIVEW